MATQICPKCKEDAFTWCVDEDHLPLTKWGCYKCGYTAWEDETAERVCPICGKKSEMKLKDDTREFWQCCNCNK